MHIQFKSVISAVQPTQINHSIAGLVMEILVLEARVNAPDDQKSKYFSMAIANHSQHLAGLLDEYERIRGEFNQSNIHQLQDEINSQKLKIAAHAKLTPLIARCMVRSRAQRIILEMEDMITLKQKIDQLPAITELKDKPDLLSAILQVPQ